MDSHNIFDVDWSSAIARQLNPKAVGDGPNLNPLGGAAGTSADASLVALKGRVEMMASRIALRYLWALTLATAAQAQAAVEYAAKSATSAISGSARQAHLGVCPLDSTLIPCVKQFYPVTFYVAVAFVSVLLWALMYPKRRF